MKELTEVEREFIKKYASKTPFVEKLRRRMEFRVRLKSNQQLKGLV
jgi:hypothetical protein